MRIVAILNQKGGVGKTTTAVNLGAALAETGRRVLLVDADPQCNLTDHLGIDPATIESSLYDVLLGDLPLVDAVRPTSTPTLFVLPAHEDLAAAEQELASEIARELRLRRAFEALTVDAYEWVLIDCPPSLGLLSLNAMAAATELIVTVQTEYFAMRGLGQIDQVIQMVRQHVNPKLRMLGILPTLVNPVTRLAREVLEEIRGHYGDVVFETRIRQNVRLAEAPGHQQHIFDYDPDSPGAADYRALAKEIQAPAPVLAPVEPPAAPPRHTHEDDPEDDPAASEADEGTPEAPRVPAPASANGSSNGSTNGAPPGDARP